MNPSVLGLEEAYELGAAWIMALSESQDIRALIIKGPRVAVYGLREKRTSADIDVLVDPSSYTQLCELLEDAGWRTRRNIFLGTLVNHSTSFVRDGWPIDLDIHHHFPGFLAPPSVAFNALWERRVPGAFGNRICAVPDRSSSIVLLALHSLRGPARQRRHLDELKQLTRAYLSTADRDALLDIACATGCELTLETVLPTLGVAFPTNSQYEGSAALALWRRRVRSGSQGAYYWIVALAEAPWVSRPKILVRAVWPTREDLLLARVETLDTVRGRWRARVHRLLWGFRSLWQYLRKSGISP